MCRTSALIDREKLKESSDAWSANATAKLHVQHLGDEAVKHVVTVKKPRQEPHPGEQLQLL